MLLSSAGSSVHENGSWTRSWTVHELVHELAFTKDWAKFMNSSWTLLFMNILMSFMNLPATTGDNIVLGIHSHFGSTSTTLPGSGSGFASILCLLWAFLSSRFTSLSNREAFSLCVHEQMFMKSSWIVREFVHELEFTKVWAKFMNSSWTEKFMNSSFKFTFTKEN